MQLEALNEVATGVMNGLPQEVVDGLEDVELIVADDAAKVCAILKEELGDDFDEKELTGDLKGVFVGSPTEIEEDEDDADAETVFYPEGYIILLSPNIESKEEGVLVLLHEIGHALGMDEDEVRNLGLGVEKKEVPNEVSIKSS